LPVPGGVKPGGNPEPPTLVIPEIRDYQRINAELATLLDQGHPRIRLEGAEGQRLLVAGLTGSWRAVVEVEGWTGPEFSADLNAPGLSVVALGPTADGAGRGLRSGTVVILGGAGDAAGNNQSGGLLIVVGPTGHRTGLAQSGGTLVVLGSTGRLASDLQSGGRFFVGGGPVGPHPGRGRRGGRLIELPCPGGLDSDDLEAWREVESAAARWVDSSSLPRP